MPQGPATRLQLEVGCQVEPNNGAFFGYRGIVVSLNYTVYPPDGNIAVYFPPESIPFEVLRNGHPNITEDWTGGVPKTKRDFANCIRIVSFEETDLEVLASAEQVEAGIDQRRFPI